MGDRKRGRRGGGPPRRSGPRPSTRRSTLPKEVVEEVRATARRGRVEDVLGLLETAVAAIEKGKSAEAQRLAEQAKRLANRSGAVREILGLAYYEGGRFREALRELLAYRRISGRADHNHLIADAHRALGSPEKAVPLAREALRAKVPPESKAEAIVVGGAALADLERYDEAVALLRAFRTNPDAARPFDLRVWYMLGDVLERAGRSREAEREFRRILRHDPEAFDVAERLAALS